MDEGKKEGRQVLRKITCVFLILSIETLGHEVSRAYGLLEKLRAL